MVQVSENTRSHPNEWKTQIWAVIISAKWSIWNYFGLVLPTVKNVQNRKLYYNIYKLSNQISLYFKFQMCYSEILKIVCESYALYIALQTVEVLDNFQQPEV